MMVSNTSEAETWHASDAAEIVGGVQTNPYPPTALLAKCRALLDAISENPSCGDVVFENLSSVGVAAGGHELDVSLSHRIAPLLVDALRETTTTLATMGASKMRLRHPLCQLHPQLSHKPRRPADDKWVEEALWTPTWFRNEVYDTLPAEIKLWRDHSDADKKLAYQLTELCQIRGAVVSSTMCLTSPYGPFFCVERGHEILAPTFGSAAIYVGRVAELDKYLRHLPPKAVEEEDESYGTTRDWMAMAAVLVGDSENFERYHASCGSMTKNWRRVIADCALLMGRHAVLQSLHQMGPQLLDDDYHFATTCNYASSDTQSQVWSRWGICRPARWFELTQHCDKPYFERLYDAMKLHTKLPTVGALCNWNRWPLDAFVGVVEVKNPDAHVPQHVLDLAATEARIAFGQRSLAFIAQVHGRDAIKPLVQQLLRRLFNALCDNRDSNTWQGVIIHICKGLVDSLQTTERCSVFSDPVCFPDCLFDPDRSVSQTDVASLQLWTDANSETPLFRAACSYLGGSSFLAELIDVGIDPLQRNTKGQTFLHVALLSKIGRQRIGIITKLACFGQLLAVADNDGKTPLLLLVDVIRQRSQVSSGELPRDATAVLDAFLRCEEYTPPPEHLWVVFQLCKVVDMGKILPTLLACESARECLRSRDASQFAIPLLLTVIRARGDRLLQTLLADCNFAQLPICHQEASALLAAAAASANLTAVAMLRRHDFLTPSTYDSAVGAIASSPYGAATAIQMMTALLPSRKRLFSEVDVDDASV